MWDIVGTFLSQVLDLFSQNYCVSESSIKIKIRSNWTLMHGKKIVQYLEIWKGDIFKKHVHLALIISTFNISTVLSYM